MQCGRMQAVIAGVKMQERAQAISLGSLSELERQGKGFSFRVLKASSGYSVLRPEIHTLSFSFWYFKVINLCHWMPPRLWYGTLS